jgi:two-component system uhpT operon response regulator UhpA
VIELSPQEARCVQMYAVGYEAVEIAEILFLSEHTVRSYIRSARTKYKNAGVDVGSKVKLLAQLIREGVVQL